MRKILMSALGLTAANLTLRLVSMLFSAYTARVMGAAGVGVLQLIFTVGGLAMTLGTAGVRVAATCLVAEESGMERPAGVRRAVRLALGYGAVTGTAAGALLFFLAQTLARRWVGTAAAAPALQLFALQLPLNCLWAVLAGYFTASGQVKKLAAVQIVDRLLSVLITVPLLQLWAAGDLSRCCCAIVGGSGAATLVSLAMLFLLYLRVRPRQKQKPPMLRRLLALCGPLAFNEMARSGLGTLENLLIPRGLRRSGAGAEAALADYGALQGMTFPAIMLPCAVLNAVSDLLIPHLSRARAQGDGTTIRGLTLSGLRLGLYWAVAAAGVLWLTGPQLGELLYHSPAAGRYIRLFAPVILILYMDAITDGLLKGLIEQVACMRYNTLTSLLDVACIALLVPRYGVAGYFFSFVATHALNFLLSIGRLVKVTDCRIPLGGLGRVLLTAAPALLVAGCIPARWFSLRMLAYLVLFGLPAWRLARR